MSLPSELKYLDRIPDAGEVRQSLQRNLREAKLLRKLLKLAVDKESVLAAGGREAEQCSQ